jgi:phage replication-related protein YjqB (UPF0714/DUF867 family)
VTWLQLLAHPAVEERAQLRGPVGFMAFHAGLEAGTLEIAEAAARSAGASLYSVVQPAGLRWHVPSARVDPADSPKLAAWLAGVARVATLHGYGRPGRHADVLVGGADRRLAGEVAGALRDALPDLNVVDDPALMPSGLRGLHPANPANLASAGGVQIELPLQARRGARADAVATALATVARRWADAATTAGPTATTATTPADHRPHSPSRVPPARQ